MEGEDRSAGGGSIIGVRVGDRIAGGGEEDQYAGGGEEDLITKLRSGFHVGLTFLCPSPYFFSPSHADLFATIPCCLFKLIPLLSASSTYTLYIPSATVGPYPLSTALSPICIMLYVGTLSYPHANKRESLYTLDKIIPFACHLWWSDWSIFHSMICISKNFSAVTYFALNLQTPSSGI